MRIVTLNARHGGGQRVDLIAAYLREQKPDVVVVTEFRNGPTGARLRSHLADAGIVHQWATQAEPRKNTVLLGSRLRGESLATTLPEGQETRFVGAVINGISVCGVYFPGLNAKIPLFDFFLNAPEALDGDAIAIGDFNTGLHRVDEAGATFYCVDRFGRLGERGWIDLWRREHGADAREFTWVSPKGKNGFRIDHAFARETIARRVRSCRYDHSTRPEITDHSAMIVDIDGGMTSA